MEYILILLWIGAMAFLASRMQFKRAKTVNGIEVNRYSWIFAFLVFFPIIPMAASRSSLLGDTYMYIDQYLNSPSNFSDIFDYVSKTGKDKGFTFIVSFLHVIFKEDFRSYFFVIALIQGIIILSVFRKYSEDYFLCIFLFVASSDYISWMFNGVRQFMAVTIILSAIGLMIEKKIVRFCIVVLFASLFHATALIMIPIYLISIGKAWNKRTIAFIVGILFIVVFVGQFTSFLDDSLQGTQYKNVISDAQIYNATGTNPLRVLVYSIPAILSFIYRKKIEKGGSLINVCANMSIVTSGLYVISAFTNGTFFGRIPIYCSLFGYILLAWLFSEAIKPESRKIVYSTTIVLYLVFYYYQMHVAYGLI